jgi:hypothetical protein
MICKAKMEKTCVCASPFDVKIYVDICQSISCISVLLISVNSAGNCFSLTAIETLYWDVSSYMFICRINSNSDITEEQEGGGKEEMLKVSETESIEIKTLTITGCARLAKIQNYDLHKERNIY